LNTRTILKTTLREQGKPACVDMLRRVTVRHRGDMDQMAWDLGITPRHLYRWLSFCRLWPEVLAARQLPPRSELLARALQEL
jgi:hypothetical protein